MKFLHAQLSSRLCRCLSFPNHEANDQTVIDFRGENASIQTYRDVETGQCPCDVRNAHTRRDFLIGNDERTGGKPPFGLRPTVGIKESYVYSMVQSSPSNVTRMLCASVFSCSTSGKCKSTYLVLMCLETFFKSLLRQKVVRHFK